jgi:hypothetical protein
MEGLIETQILILAFSNTPILQRSQTAYFNVACVLCALCGPKPRAALTGTRWNGAAQYDRFWTRGGHG